VILFDDWGKSAGVNGRNVDEVKVRVVVAYAKAERQPPTSLANLCKLPSLTSLHLIGARAQHILGEMALDGGVRVPPGVTRICISKSRLTGHTLEECGWWGLHPSNHGFGGMESRR
jgi:hypothetical protein